MWRWLCSCLVFVVVVVVVFLAFAVCACVFVVVVVVWSFGCGGCSGVYVCVWSGGGVMEFGGGQHMYVHIRSSPPFGSCHHVALCITHCITRQVCPTLLGLPGHAGGSLLAPRSPATAHAPQAPLNLFPVATLPRVAALCGFSNGFIVQLGNGRLRAPLRARERNDTGGARRRCLFLTLPLVLFFFFAW